MRSWRMYLVTILLLIGGIAFLWWRAWRLEHSQDVPIRAAAERYGVEPAIVKAIVWRESHFNPEARGRSGELGLMQIREDAAREWAEAEKIQNFDHAHCLNPRTNTLAGTWYFRKMLRRFADTDNPLPYALAAYNAGRANALKWNNGTAATNSFAFVEEIKFPSTKAYVRAIMKRYENYRGSFPAAAGAH